MITVVTSAITNVTDSGAVSGGTITGDNSGEYMPLVDRLMKNKFQLYNRTRQKFIGDIISKEFIKPFQLVTATNQGGKQFVVGGFKYDITQDKYSSFELFEYDNTTDITLVDYNP